MLAHHSSCSGYWLKLNNSNSNIYETFGPGKKDEINKLYSLSLICGSLLPFHALFEVTRIASFNDLFFKISF